MKKQNQELKTLKDLMESEEHPFEFSALDLSIELKAEAVKWVKEWERQKSEINREDGEFSDKRWLVLEGKIKSFVNFHNITEEDLK